jgi:hypothetical protein
LFWTFEFEIWNLFVIWCLELGALSLTFAFLLLPFAFFLPTIDSQRENLYHITVKL